MKSYLLLFIFLFLTNQVWGFQQWQELRLQKQKSEQTAMKVLLGWSAVSLAGSGILAANGNTNSAAMHAGWAVINAGIAGASLLSKKKVPSTHAEYLQNEKVFNQILAINTGLDVAYVTTGLALQEMGKTKRERDFGSAIMIQGGFLLIFDIILFKKSGNRLTKGIDLITGISRFGETGRTQSVNYSYVGFRYSLSD